MNMGYNEFPEWINVYNRQSSSRYHVEKYVRAQTLECHEVISDNLNESEGTGDAWANCSECGELLYVLTDKNSKKPRYCPHCGRKVVKE